MKRYILGIAILATSVLSIASEVDKRPIEIVVPYATGGTATQVAQFVSKVFSKNNWPNVVINKPGANTVIGTNYVAKSTPNGHTLLIGTASSMSAAMVFPSPGMEYTEKSFTPIALLHQTSLALGVASTSPIQNYEQFKSYVRENPKKFNLGVYNNSIAGVFVEWAKKEKLPPPNIILYKGSSQIDIDLAGGNLEFAFDNFGWGSPMLPLVNANKIRVLAILDSTAAKLLNTKVVNLSRTHPELEFSAWFGLYAPVGTPKPTIEEMNVAINRAVLDPEFQGQVKEMAGVGGKPADLLRLQQRDIATLKRLSLAVD